MLALALTACLATLLACVAALEKDISEEEFNACVQSVKSQLQEKTKDEKCYAIQARCRSVSGSRRVKLQLSCADSDFHRSDNTFGPVLTEKLSCPAKNSEDTLQEVYEQICFAPWGDPQESGSIYDPSVVRVNSKKKFWKVIDGLKPSETPRLSKVAEFLLKALEMKMSQICQSFKATCASGGDAELKATVDGVECSILQKGVSSPYEGPIKEDKMVSVARQTSSAALGFYIKQLHPESRLFSTTKNIDDLLCNENLKGNVLTHTITLKDGMKKLSKALTAAVEAIK